MGLTLGTVSAIKATTSASTETHSVTMTAGRAYVCAIGQRNTSGGRTYALSDDLGNTWSKVENAGSGGVCLAYCICTTGGSATWTITVTGGAVTFSSQAIEWVPDGGYTLAFDDSGTFNNTTTTSLVAASTTEFDPANDSGIVACFSIGSGTFAYTQGGTYTSQGTGGSRYFCQTRLVTGGALTDHQPDCTTDVSGSQKAACMSIVATASGGNALTGRIIGGAVGRSGVLGA